MDETQFWAIIATGGPEASADPERQLAAIRRELSRLSPEEVRQFQQRLREKVANAYTWDLWAAAYLINGGCSDDGFHYFREWLVSRGRAVYEAAVQDPDSLAGFTDPERDDYEFEELGYLPLEVYQALTGSEMPPVEFSRLTGPRGERWDFADDAEIERRLPKLGQVYAA